MRQLVFIFFISISTLTFAQMFPSEEWYVGEATLSSGEEVKGQIKYDLEIEAIQVETNGRINTYNASQVVFFSIKPNEERPNRLFTASLIGTKLVMPDHNFLRLLRRARCR